MNYLCLNHQCDRQMDRQTDGRTERTAIAMVCVWQPR